MSNNEIEFVNGLYFQEPSENAPQFVKGKLSIHRDKLLQWLNQTGATNNQGYINCDIKVARSGKPYIAVDNWKPTQGQQQPHTPQQQPQTPTAPQQEISANSGNFDGGEVPF